MGRLIDENILIENVMKRFIDKSLIESFKKIIDDTPTVYDMEKVVARLEEEVEYQDKKADEAGVFDKVSLSNARITMRKCYEHAIEIVRKGGAT